MFAAWLRFTMDATLLGLETQRVVGLRLMKISAGGPKAHAEAQLMFAEKTAAFAEAAATIATGGSAHKVVRRYRTHVRANARRLTRSPKR